MNVVWESTGECRKQRLGAGGDVVVPAAADGRRERPERSARGGPRRPGIAVTRAGETMMRVVEVFVGHEV